MGECNFSVISGNDFQVVVCHREHAKVLQTQLLCPKRLEEICCKRGHRGLCALVHSFPFTAIIATHQHTIIRMADADMDVDPPVEKETVKKGKAKDSSKKRFEVKKVWVTNLHRPRASGPQLTRSLVLLLVERCVAVGMGYVSLIELTPEFRYILLACLHSPA